MIGRSKGTCIMDTLWIIPSWKYEVVKVMNGSELANIYCLLSSTLWKILVCAGRETIYLAV